MFVLPWPLAHVGVKDDVDGVGVTLDVGSS